VSRISSSFLTLKLGKALLALERRYGGGVIKTGGEMIAEKRFEDAEINEER